MGVENPKALLRALFYLNGWIFCFMRGVEKMYLNEFIIYIK